MYRFCALLLASLSLLAQPSPRTKSPSAAVKAMVAYPLTASNLDRYAEASRAMSALMAIDPGVLPKLKPSPTDAPTSIDETVAFTKRRCPECVAAVEKAMPYREYILFQGGLMISYISAIRPRPSSQVHVTPENIRFVLDNREKIDHILAEQRKQPAVKAP